VPQFGLHGVDGAAGRGDDLATGRRRLQPARGALEERCAQPPLHLRHRPAERRLSDEQPLGGRREAAGVVHRDHHAQLLQREIHAHRT
jgi:hypothetical protein